MVMPRVDVVVRSPVADSFRVRQVEGMFDLTHATEVEQEFSAELPEEEETWQIGAIVGPSGSGKTTIAQAAFAKQCYKAVHWPRGKAIVDCLGDQSIKTITHTLVSVGFSSPPAWRKPYHILSQGEQFRCDLARALLRGGEFTVFDEFTSVVDRTVAQVASLAVAKAIRSGRIAKRFIAVTCHEDVLAWLQPDWWLDTSCGQLSRRRLRRPDVDLAVFLSKQSAWSLFAPHHYLSPTLSPYAECYLAIWKDRPVGFVAILNAIGRKGMKRISRLAVLPDFQGIGIGSALAACVAEIYHQRGFRVMLTSSHPAIIHLLKHSATWRVRSVKPWGHSPQKSKEAPTCSFGRPVVSGEYVGTGTAGS